MDKKKSIITALFVSIILMGTIFLKKEVIDKVCISPLVNVDGVGATTGLYLCFDGENIGKEIDGSGVLSGEEKEFVNLVGMTSTPGAMIKSGRVDLAGVESKDSYKYIKNFNQMWNSVTGKRILFSARYEDTVKYAVSGSYKGRRLVMQAELESGADGLLKLKMNRSKDNFSRILARWHVYAGDLPDSALAVGVGKRLGLIFGYKKKCPEDNYCLFYRDFVFSNDPESTEGNKIWGAFVGRINSGDFPAMLASMDSRSWKNLGVLAGVAALEKPAIKYLDYLKGTVPVAYLYGENSVVVFVADGGNKIPLRSVYAEGATFPIFFVRKNGSERYVAVEVNEVNELHEFVKRIDFRG